MKSKSPVLRDIRKTITVTLPSFPTSKVILWEDLLGYQSKEIGDIKNDFDAGVTTLTFLIKEWNFVDEDDKSMDISAKALGQLPQRDLTFLFTKIFDAVRAREKKTKKNLKE